MIANKKRDYKRVGIYLIRNRVTGKVYIGKSINIHGRIKGHITALNTRSKDENRYLINSWHKYGRDAFEYEVLEDLPKDDKILKERELYWMEKYNSLNKEFGYNLRKDTRTNCIMKDETRDLMSISTAMQYKTNPEAIERSRKYNTGKKQSRETIEQVRKNRREFNIIQFDKNGKFVKRWKGVHEILKINPNFRPQNIYSSCNGHKGKHRGYFWRYWDKNNPINPKTLNDAPIMRSEKYEPKIVYMFDENFNFIAKYNSCGECAEANKNKLFNNRSVVSTVGGNKRTFFYRGYYLYGDENLPDNLRGLVK